MQNQEEEKENLTTKNKDSWESLTYDLGVVEHAKKYPFTFTYIGDGKIGTMSPACGCTAVKKSGENLNIVTGTLKIGSVPARNKNNCMLVSKPITVTLKGDSNNKNTVLRIMAKAYDPKRDTTLKTENKD